MLSLLKLILISIKLAVEGIVILWVINSSWIFVAALRLSL